MYFDKSSIKCWQFKYRNKNSCIVPLSHTVTLSQSQSQCLISKLKMWVRLSASVKLWVIKMEKGSEIIIYQQTCPVMRLLWSPFSRRSLKSSFCQRLRLAHIEGPLITAPADTPDTPPPHCQGVTKWVVTLQCSGDSGRGIWRSICRSQIIRADSDKCLLFMAPKSRYCLTWCSGQCHTSSSVHSRYNALGADTSWFISHQTQSFYFP